VPIYGSGGFTTDTEDRLRGQLRGWVEQGIPRVKIKIGESWGTCEPRDLERVALARQTIGADVELYVDANGGYDHSQAVRVGSRLDEQGVTWFEEPVSSDDHVGLRRVREAVTADVTAGEYGDSLAYFTHLLAADTVDCVQVDVTRCGGYTEWLRIVTLAAASGLEVSGHCAPSLHACVAAATPNLRHVEWFADHVRIESRFLESFPIPHGGNVVPGESPGHGLTLRETDLTPYRVA
jgi:L-alanine-DL-glutamate epimerase-like enolase superfamily enzyme